MLAARLTAQLLAGPSARTPEAAVSRLLAVQAQDSRGFRLSIRSRTHDLSADDVDSALNDRRSLVVAWLNRGTLHLVSADDYWWLHRLTTPQLETGNARRLMQEGVSAVQVDRAVEVVFDEVTRQGPRTREELRVALNDAGVPASGQALLHLLVAASLRGDLVRGPVRGREHCFVSASQWLGARADSVDRDAALARLARRYLAGHGPASVVDLAKWAGITLGDARRGIAAIADEVDEADQQFDLMDRPAPAALPPPRLLGPFDPLLHGWVSREFITRAHPGIVTTNGVFRPFALVDGRAVAKWGLEGGRVRIRLLESVTATTRRALEAEAGAVHDFLGMPRAEPIVVPA